MNEIVNRISSKIIQNNYKNNAKVGRRFFQFTTIFKQRNNNNINCNINNINSVSQLFSHNIAKYSTQVEYFLGIETSCDDTAIAIVGTDKTVVANCVSSQFHLHSQYGGIVPHLAQRAHKENFPLVYKRTIEIWEKFKEEKLKEENKQVKLKGIGVTIGPGLSPCLWVGLSNARSISKELNIPIYAINHLEAHSLVVRLNNDVDFPFLLLLVSGGHTQLLLCHDVAQYTLLGKKTTLDDSLGEAFDKVARILQLPLSNGHAGEQLENLAKYAKTVDVRDEEIKANIAASFQYSAIKLILRNTQRAIEQTNPSSLVVAGGVARNNYLKESLQQICASSNVNLLFPPSHLCTDNGAMVAWAAIERMKKGYLTDIGDDENECLECFAKLPLDSEMKIIDTSSLIFKKMKRLL